LRVSKGLRANGSGILGGPKGRPKGGSKKRAPHQPY
jgi:hypothetical protein